CTQFDRTELGESTATTLPESATVMVQRELEFASAQRSGNPVTGGTFHERETQTVLGPGKGGHPTAASPGEEAGVRFVRSVRHSSHALLPLAEGVLRERRRRL